MCLDLSGLLLRPTNGENGRIILCENTNSHEEQIAYEGLKEGATQNFIRWEYSPRVGSGDWADCVLKIDETLIPSWLDQEQRDRLEADAAAWVKSRTITQDQSAVLGGTWIVVGKVAIKYGNRCRFLVSKGAELVLGDIRGEVAFGHVYGTVTTGCVYGTVTTGTTTLSGTVTTGYVSGTGSVKTGDVSGTGSVKSSKKVQP